MFNISKENLVFLKIFIIIKEKIDILVFLKSFLLSYSRKPKAIVESLIRLPISFI